MSIKIKFISEKKNIDNKTKSSQHKRSSQNFLNNPEKLTLNKYKIHPSPSKQT
jgi:hypothetical protein